MVATLKAMASLMGAAPYGRLPARLLPDALSTTMARLHSLLARLRAASTAAPGATAASELAAAALAALRCVSAGLGSAPAVPAVALALADGASLSLAASSTLPRSPATGCCRGSPQEGCKSEEALEARPTEQHEAARRSERNLRSTTHSGTSARRWVLTACCATHAGGELARLPGMLIELAGGEGGGGPGGVGGVLPRVEALTALRALAHNYLPSVTTHRSATLALLARLLQAPPAGVLPPPRGAGACWPLPSP